MAIAPDLAQVIHQQIHHQNDLLTLLHTILQTLQRLTERVAGVEDLLSAILESDEEEDVRYDD